MYTKLQNIAYLIFSVGVMEQKILRFFYKQDEYLRFYFQLIKLTGNELKILFYI